MFVSRCGSAKHGAAAKAISVNMLTNTERNIMRDFTLRSGEDYIKLGQLLKAAGLVDEGSDAKHAIENEEVTVNGEVCTMRGKKIHDGDVVGFESEEIHVHQHA